MCSDCGAPIEESERREGARGRSGQQRGAREKIQGRIAEAHPHARRSTRNHRDRGQPLVNERIPWRGGMRSAVQRAASWLDALLVAVREVLKACVNELFHLGSSLATALTVLVMLVFHRPGASDAPLRGRNLTSAQA